MAKINLHNHTVFSDGTKSVKDVVDGLRKAGVSTFSITDHDTVKGNVEAIELAEKFNMKFITGVEMSSIFDGEGNLFDNYTCHILGLGVNIGQMAEVIGINNRYYLLPTIKENIENIKRCGGVAVWAHPFNVIYNMRMIELDKIKIEQILKDMKRYGLDGIEVYYQDFSIEQIKYLEKLSHGNKLLASIGTDYHGDTNRFSNQFIFEKEGIIPNPTILQKLNE
ncbi:MAG: PHP domain-containing protein [Firmicutes bacterium]|nr:PHP domain-containing protein [Bacillota bacterium]